MFRYRRDGEADRGHARHYLRPETTQEGETTKESAPSTAHSFRFFLQQAWKGCRFFKEGHKKATKTKKAGKKSAAVPGDDDVLTFEQKKDLSEAIQTLDGQKLERVIQIIHEGVPEI